MKGKSKKGAQKITASEKHQLKNMGERIRQLRIAKGYSSYEYYAYEKGFSRAQFGRYETGQDLYFSTLVRVIESFDMTLEEFFSEGFEPKSK